MKLSEDSQHDCELCAFSIEWPFQPLWTLSVEHELRLKVGKYPTKTRAREDMKSSEGVVLYVNGLKKRLNSSQEIGQ